MKNKQFRDEELSQYFKKSNEIDRCICCGEEECLTLWTKTKKFPAFQCGNCGFVYMNPQPNITGLNDYYNNYLGKRRINNLKKNRAKKYSV